MSFFKNLLNTVRSLATSKKAIAAVSTAIAGVIAPRFGADQSQVALIVASGIGYVLAQGQADKGKEAAKIIASRDWSESDRVLAARLKILADALAPVLAPRPTVLAESAADPLVPMDRLP